MASDFDRDQFVNSMDKAIKVKEHASELGLKLADDGIRRIVMVACGANNREMSVIKYWLDSLSTNLDCRLYFPAELINQDPPIFDEKTVVIFGSHSGTTPETIDAAKYVQKFPCKSVCVTQVADSPLAKNVTYPFIYGKSPDEGYQHGYYSFYMIAQALVSAIMSELENWDLHEKLIAGLDRFPMILADAMDSVEARVTEEARIYHNDKYFYLVGSGPMFCTTYVMGICVLMEMQWLHTCPFEAAEFFHGPFEIVDENTPLILMLGEDPSRPEAERVVQFCKKHTERLLVYDSKDFNMDGIPNDLRPLFAPFVVQAALDRLAEHLAVWHNHPLSTRRYMWKSEY